jgi:hypothetical protein
MTHTWQAAFYWALFFLLVSIGRQYVTSRKRRMDESRSITIGFPRPREYRDFHGLAPRFRGLMREEQFKHCSLVIGGRWIPIWPPPPDKNRQPRAVSSQGENS